jgi:hypothetical protein
MYSSACGMLHPCVGDAGPCVHPVLRLQRTIGNQAVQRLLNSGVRKTKPGAGRSLDSGRFGQRSSVGSTAAGRLLGGKEVWLQRQVCSAGRICRQEEDEWASVGSDATATASEWSSSTATGTEGGLSGGEAGSGWEANGSETPQTQSEGEQWTSGTQSEGEQWTSGTQSEGEEPDQPWAQSARWWEVIPLVAGAVKKIGCIRKTSKVTGLKKQCMQDAKDKCAEDMLSEECEQFLGGAGFPSDAILDCIRRKDPEALKEFLDWCGVAYSVTLTD